MSTTLNQLVFDIYNTKRAGVLSDDDNISERLIEFWIRNVRSLLIRQDYQKKRSLSENIIQSLGCVLLELVDKSTCCDSITADCNILRSTQRIPQPIEVDQKDLITRIGPIDLSTHGYSIIPYSRVPYVGSNKYTRFFTRAFVKDNYVYVMTNNDLLEYINVQGVFEDPVEVKNFSHCDGLPCYTDNDSYPISSWMIPAIKEIILKSDFAMTSIAGVDNTNDSKAEYENQQKK